MLNYRSFNQICSCNCVRERESNAAVIETTAYYLHMTSLCDLCRTRRFASSDPLPQVYIVPSDGLWHCEPSLSNGVIYQGHFLSVNVQIVHRPDSQIFVGCCTTCRIFAFEIRIGVVKLRASQKRACINNVSQQLPLGFHSTVRKSNNG